MFIRYPKWFSPGTVIIDQIASNIDIAPTFLELAGIPDTFGMDGVSLRKLAGDEISRKEFFYEFGGKENVTPPLRAVRTLQYKYVNYYCNDVTEEFFDLVNDPSENNNLIANVSYSGLIQTYREKLDSLRTSFEDYEPLPINCFLSHPTFEKTELSEEQDNDQIFPSLRIIPNPATQFFSIQYEGKSSMAPTDVKVMNVLGELVLIEHLLPDSNSPLMINCTSWLEGVYLVTFKTNDAMVSERIIVVR